MSELSKQQYNQESELERTREFTLQERLSILTREERDKLFEEALVKYNELEDLIHGIAEFNQQEVQDALF